MSDELSDPQASAPAHLPSSTESIPPPAEPKTPAWLTWLGLGILLIALGWLAVRCEMESSPSESGTGPATPSALPTAE